ncbi:hypothetical protein LCGC14_0598100 [marine sediment metagenome]|uniref:DUF2187 domain-containing protein n=1 Tax=marine sediment metagenome TaxID=412755 RepID=A0A0F9TXL4_9ZZZZ
MKINDRVRVGDSIDDSNPIDSELIGQIATVIKIDESEAPSVTVEFKLGNIESFWPEELTKVR